MLRLWLFSLTILSFLCCSPTGTDKDPPKDHPYYPSALLQKGETLYVLSSNFDRRYVHGSILTVDLNKVDAAIANRQDLLGGTESVSSSGFIPSFSAAPVFSPKGDQIVYVSRDEMSIRTIPLTSTLQGLIACDGSVGPLSQDCYSSSPAAHLNQTNPYFLHLFPANNQDIAGGIVAFPFSSASQRTGTQADFELRRFTWNEADSRAQLSENLALGEILKASFNQPASSIGARASARIGAMTLFGDHAFFLVDSPVKKDGFGRAVLLVRIPLASLRDLPSGDVRAATYDLAANTNIDSIGALEVRGSGANIDIFATSERHGFVLKLTMAALDSVDEKGNLKLMPAGEIWACDTSNDIKLTPDFQKLVVACDDGKILIYDAEHLRPLSLHPSFGAPLGRGPVKILFDSRFSVSPFRFYTANFLDGSIGVYELRNSPLGNFSLLTPLGHIFQPSAQRREGGIE